MIAKTLCMVLATYNLENYFYSQKSNFQIKTKKIAQVLHSMREPDCLGGNYFALEEIENELVLNRLVQELNNFSSIEFSGIITHGDDKRGINTAFIYQKKFLKIHQIKEIKILNLGYGTRRILSIDGEIEGHKWVQFLINHWPSKMNPESDRIKVAEILKKQFMDNRNIFIMGDFNSEKIHFKSFDEFPLLFKKNIEGSYFYQLKRKYYLLDHIQFKNQSFQNVMANSEIIANFEQFKLLKPKYFWEWSRYKLIPRKEKEGGISDHFPVKLKITFH